MEENKGAFDENGDAITRGYVAPGLDKEILLAIHCRNTQEFNFVCNYLNITNANWHLYGKRTCINLPEKSISDIESNNRDYITSLEYAEKHYLKIIEEKDKIVDDREKWANDLITEKDFLTIELQQAKGLLKRALQYAEPPVGLKSDIGKFLNK